MDKNNNYLNLKKFCRGLGVDLFGVADISGIKKDFMLGGHILGCFDKAISLGVRLSWVALEEIKDAPTKLYFHHYRTANAALDQTAFRVGNHIQNKGYSSLPIAASQILDWQEQKAHLSHKEIARLAGLGWIGRNNLLVNPKFGAQLRLATILTDMPLKLDKPMQNGCLECRRCVKACPAQAIKEDAAGFDHAACFAKLKEFQKQHLVEQYICGVCVNACLPDGSQGRGSKAQPR